MRLQRFLLCLLHIVTPTLGRPAEGFLSVALLDVLNRAEQKLGSNATAPFILAIQGNTDALNSIASNGLGLDATGRARSACQALGVLFGNNLIAADSSSYVTVEQEPWSTTCWLPAACFLQVHDTIDVPVGLAVVTYLDSQFSVRSRGHNPNTGFSSVGQTGVLLDLRTLDRVNPNTDGDMSYLTAEPGASWGSLYAALDPYGKSVIGARDEDVGVGGLLLGGGMPYFSNLYGLASDNVKNFQVVLANSSLVDANEKENPDLYYALRGGGPNYGIITRVDLYTVPLHNVWYKLAIYAPSDYRAVLAATARLREFARHDSKLGFFMNANPAGLFVGIMYAEWTPVPDAYAPFLNLTPTAILADSTNGTILSLSQAVSGTDGVHNRYYGASVTQRFDASLYVPMHERYLELANFSDSASGGLSYTIQPVSSAVAAFQQQRGGSPFTVQPVDQDWIVIPVSWSDPANDVAAMGATNSLLSAAKANAKASGDLLDLVFMNDAAANQSPLKSYGTNALRKMQKIARAYDPEGVFQDLQYGGFLLSKV